MTEFNLSDVYVTDEYYNECFELEVKYLTSLNVDKLLAGFRETAGYACGYTPNQVTEYMNNATRYQNTWESTLIGGHTLGHYMSACAQCYVNPALKDSDKAIIKKNIDTIISSLADCQEKTRNSSVCKYGFLFGGVLHNHYNSNLEFQFDNVEKRETNILFDAWVPWYTCHKILAGLLSIYNLTDNNDSLIIACNLGEWIYNRTRGWSPKTNISVLSTEYGGMNDCLYDLYIASKKIGYKDHDHFLKAAMCFDEEQLFSTVYNNTSNALNNIHANTTIPKFLGSLKRYIATDDTLHLNYALSFWDMVTKKHTYITGGNSEDEHFGMDYILANERSNCNCETCNTYNMLKLTKELFKITGDVKYADYYENTLVNAILPSQNHNTGMTMYFQPMASGYQKVFSSFENSFWCCTGSGMENFTKLNDAIYFKEEDTIIINQYISSILSWKEKNIKLTQKSLIQTAQGTTSQISIEYLNKECESQNIDKHRKKFISLKLRVPNWNAGTIYIQQNEKEIDYQIHNGYIYLKDIEINSTISINIPMQINVYSLQDNENTKAFKYGPVVLSACLGKDKQSTTLHGMSVTIPNTCAIENDNITITQTDKNTFFDEINNYMQKTDSNEKLTFQLQGCDKQYDFIPHYLQDESYGIYFNFIEE